MKLLKKFGLACALIGSAFASTQANASYDFWGNGEAAGSPYGQLVGDPGTYDTFVLGEDISFNACSATFAGYSLCDLPDTSKFWIGWAAETRNESGNTFRYQSIGGWANQSDNPGLNVTLTNQENSQVFGSAGTFYLGLYVVAYSNTYIPLPGGGYAYTGNSEQRTGWLWTSGLTMAEEGSVPVPEPAAALLLLPGLFMLRRKEKLRRENAV